MRRIKHYYSYKRKEAQKIVEEHWPDKTPAEERRAYIPILEGAGYCERLNHPKNKLFFADKGETYRVFGKYFHRDQVEVMKWTPEETENLRQFVERYPRSIIPYAVALPVLLLIIS